MRSHHRTVRGAVISAGALVVVALVASTALAKRPAPQPIRIKAPAAGKYSITAVSLTAKKAPRLRVVGRLPSDLAVALGVAKDRKHAGRYVGFVALLHKAARKTQAVGRGEATFVVAVDPGGAEAAGLLSLREAIARANQGDTITFANTTIVNGPAGATGGGLLLDITSGNLTLTNSIITGNTAPPPPPPPPPTSTPTILCTTSLVNQGTPFEVIGTTGCTGGTFNALQFVPLNGNVVVDQFPEQGQAQCAIQPNGSLICIFPALTGTSGPIDVREQAAPNGFTVMRSSDGGQTWDAATWASSGP